MADVLLKEGARVRALGVTSGVTTQPGDLGTIRRVTPQCYIVEWDDPQFFQTGGPSRKEWGCEYHEVESG